MSDEELSGYAIAVARPDGQWQCSRLSPVALTELDAAITQLRRAQAVLGMIAVDDEFFVLIRLSTTGVSVLLSDSAAGLDYDIAADVLDLLRVDPPDEDDFELWPAGDLAIVHDLGMPEFELEVIVSDIDLYPDDQLESIANRCGFGEQWNEALMAKPQRVP